MTLKEVQDAANELIALYQLEDWTFRFNKRRVHLGLCSHNKRTIYLSIYYARKGTTADILDTIRHEIAHALVGPSHGHDAVWKAKAVELGATPKACNDKVSLTESGEGAKWVAACGCGQAHYRYRKPKRMQGWYCKRVGRKAGELVWKPTS